MSVFEKGLIMILGCALLFVLLAIPLILRRVPRNIVCGFGTLATLSNDFVWYEANAHLGRGLIIASIISAIATVILYKTRCLSPGFSLKASTAVLVAPPLVAAGQPEQSSPYEQYVNRSIVRKISFVYHNRTRWGLRL